MERLNTYVSPANRAICETPEVLQSVRVNFPAYIFNRMVNNLMRVFLFQSIVRKQSIRIKSSASLNVCFNFSLKSFLAAIRYDHCYDFAVSPFGLVATFEDSHNG